MLFSDPINFLDEYEEIEITIGQYIKFDDDNDGECVGQVLNVNQEMDVVQVTRGTIIITTHWITAELIIEA
ncbi:MAG: hypothetical protein V7K98_23985 [Nostoc sp.]|uniref:hypothetical protein n=1 Tax=Nostoc sp. TaxID=1180 RepID=UPI002FF62785